MEDKNIPKGLEKYFEECLEKYFKRFNFLTYQIDQWLKTDHNIFTTTIKVGEHDVECLVDKYVQNDIIQYYRKSGYILDLDFSTIKYHHYIDVTLTPYMQRKHSKL